MIARPLPVVSATFAVVFSLASAPGQAPTQGARQIQTIATNDHLVEVVEVVGGLEHPWGLAILPDGRMLVTERPGRLRILSEESTLSDPLEGVPKVFAQGQGGLMDVALDPNFAENQLVYLSFAEPGEGGASTAVGRGKLEDDRIEGFTVVFRQQPKVPGANHFGNRMAFSEDGLLHIALGDRFKFEPAQELSNTLGTVVRVKPDGSIPEDNPFVGDENAEDAIYSYGHRNLESAAFDPATGNLWVAEMGPLGGDELNLVEAGANYGWPMVSWGWDYDGEPIPKPSTKPGFKDAAKVWTPVISPSGMAFYEGDRFPKWQGKMLIGGLSAHDLVVVTIDGKEAEEHVRLPVGGRVREVEVGPDGFIYILIDKKDGSVWRLQPLTS